MDARAWFTKYKGQYRFLKRKKGRGWVVWRVTKKRKKLVAKGPAWILADSVRLPGPKTDGSKSRLGFFDTWDRFAGRRKRRNKRAIKLALRDALRTR
jgi:hypothetical protein